MSMRSIDAPDAHTGAPRTFLRRSSIHFISTVTDAVHPEVTVWQGRPLEPMEIPSCSSMRCA
jgi:hypothetical protein